MAILLYLSNKVLAQSVMSSVVTADCVRPKMTQASPGTLYGGPTVRYGSLLVRSDEPT